MPRKFSPWAFMSPSTPIHLIVSLYELMFAQSKRSSHGSHTSDYHMPNMRGITYKPVKVISQLVYVFIEDFMFFWISSKRGNSLQTQLPVGRSFLNAHSFSINLADSDLCLCSRSETTTHYLTQCFLYTAERRHLYNSLEQLLPKFKTLCKDLLGIRIF